MARKDRHTFLDGGLMTWIDRFGSLPRSKIASRKSRIAGRRATSFFPQPFGVRIGSRWRASRVIAELGMETDSFVKGLILAQNERWRRGLGMQVERVRSSDRVSGARVSKATVTNPMVGHSRGKLRVIPSDVRAGHPLPNQSSGAVGRAVVVLGSWRGNGPPSL